MILLVSEKADVQAHWLASQWAGANACLLTPEDLSRPGWSVQPGSDQPWTAVASGTVFGHAEPLAGVINLLRHVGEQHLAHVAQEDRAYVAQEMTAGLFAWQRTLTCPVLNQPRPGCLTGPELSVEAWLHLAAGLGIPVRALTRSSGAPRSSRARGDCQAVTVIGDHTMGGEPDVRHHALRLARAAGVDLLTVFFSLGRHPAFVGAALCHDFATPEAAAALLHCVAARSTC